MQSGVVSATTAIVALLLGACQAEGTSPAKRSPSQAETAATANADARAADTADASGTQDAGTERPLREDEIAERADFSFSSYPLREEALGLNAQGFTVVEGSCAPEGDECTWINADHVRHTLDSNNILYIKSVEARDFGGRPIAALGIGTARDRAAVLRNVSAFLQGSTLECREAGEAGEGDGIASCGATLGEGWIKILFNAENRLISARIDAYQAN